MCLLWDLIEELDPSQILLQDLDSDGQEKLREGNNHSKEHLLVLKQPENYLSSPDIPGLLLENLEMSSNQTFQR